MVAVTSGVGMGLKACDRGLEITEILPNGPLHRAGKVRVGDILKKVDGKVVGEMNSAKELLTGPQGTTVTLTVLRHSPFGMPDAISVCVVRGSATTEGMNYERPDSGNYERPPVPNYYTPFTGSLSVTDAFKSGIDDFARQYLGTQYVQATSSGSSQNQTAGGAQAFSMRGKDYDSPSSYDYNMPERGSGRPGSNLTTSETGHTMN